MSATLAAAETPVRSALSRLRAELASESLPEGWPRGVVGAFGPDQAVLYGYPEIAGYWLRWASARAEVSDRCGAAVLAWLEARGDAAKGWPTRVPAAHRRLDDNYSHAHYVFDHAMLWDGVRRWAQARHDAFALRLASRVWDYLQTFAAPPHAAKAIPVVGRGRLPPRWAGRQGPFLLKVAARLSGQDGPLADSCRRAVPHLIVMALESPHEEAHPQLYAIEGMLELGYAAEARHALEALADAHGGLLALRESEGGGPQRCDVLAQALRAALLCGVDAPADALAGRLAGLVESCGRVPFASGPGPQSRPTWASLFAEQALSAWLGESLLAKDIV
jgi:hypothetical protein